MFLIKGTLSLAILILSLKTGLILGASWLSKKSILSVSTILGTSLYVIIWVFKGYQEQLVYFLDNYTFLGACLISLLLIYLGLQIPEFKKEDEDKGKKYLYVFSFLPCPFCMLALAFSVFLFAPVLEMDVLQLGKRMGLIFAIMIFAVSMIARKMIALLKVEPMVIFNNILLSLGFITLLFAFTVPNIVQAVNIGFNPLVINSPKLLGVLTIGIIGLILLGYFIYQKNQYFRW
ncbi:MAG: hypothetical protein H0Z40_02875 [Desulfotomaculum sp.]|nr:hypothetical protein [Desulfotomaculum sp.]